MNADVNERAEVDNVSYNAGKLHALGEVFHCENSFLKLGKGETVADVTSGLCKLADNIVQRGHTAGELFRKLSRAVALNLIGKAGQTACGNVRFGVAEFCEKGAGNAV